jgi:hypothetical protein
MTDEGKEDKMAAPRPKKKVTEAELQAMLADGWEVNGKLISKGVERTALRRYAGGKHQTRLVQVVGEEVTDAPTDKAAA